MSEDIRFASLRELVVACSSEGPSAFASFLAQQCEICELKLLAIFHSLDRPDQVEQQVHILNAKHSLALDPSYIAARWEKLFGAGHPGELSDLDKNLIYERDSWACVYCGSAVKLELHHVLPRAAQGPDSPSNLVCACEKCNRRIGCQVVLPDSWWLLHPESRHRP